MTVIDRENPATWPESYKDGEVHWHAYTTELANHVDRDGAPRPDYSGKPTRVFHTPDEVLDWLRGIRENAERRTTGRWADQAERYPEPWEFTARQLEQGCTATLRLRLSDSQLVDALVQAARPGQPWRPGQIECHGHR